MFLVLFVFAQRLLETLQKHASDHAKKIIKKNSKKFISEKLYNSFYVHCVEYLS